MVRRAVDTLRSGVGEMRDALTGRNYVADYVQTFTHEIKSPLSAIRGAAELLQEPSMPQAERERFLANIARETAAHPGDRRPHDGAHRARDAARAGAQRAGRAGAAAARGGGQRAGRGGGARASACIVAIDTEARVEGDPFLLRRAVSNLLDNAIDFSPPDAEVAAGACMPARAKPASPCATMAAAFPTTRKDKVFEKFYSLARPHSQKKSTGLGLAFVKEIAALHRGRIELANAPRGGALATLTLPLASHG